MSSGLPKFRYSEDCWVEGELYFRFDEKDVKNHAWCMLCRSGFHGRNYGLNSWGSSEGPKELFQFCGFEEYRSCADIDPRVRDLRQK
jgi:hypothetical protein